MKRTIFTPGQSLLTYSALGFVAATTTTLLVLLVAVPRYVSTMKDYKVEISLPMQLLIRAAIFASYPVGLFTILLILMLMTVLSVGLVMALRPRER